MVCCDCTHATEGRDRARVRARQVLLTALWRAHHRLLVPTYDMDLMWHAHMSYPAAYQSDMLRIALRRVGHDDSINDRCAAVCYSPPLRVGQ